MKTSPERNWLVLIVDDSPETLGMLNEALEIEKMTTLVALEGKQAINIAKKMTPDVILLDAIMPSMDGFETCASIKSDSQLRNIPVIFMTGLSDTESIVKGFSVGGVDYVTKPINPNELVARIHVHLANARNTLSAQTALDVAGQNIFSVNEVGEKLWSTPEVDKLLDIAETAGHRGHMQDEICTWLSHSPEEGNRLRFTYTSKDQSAPIKLTAIYFGVLNNGEHLIRLMDDESLDEASSLKSHFRITHREAEVLLWTAKGKANREIAEILNMSPRTVNKHLEQLFKKMSVENRTCAATLATQHLQKI